VANWNPTFKINLLDVLDSSYDSEGLKDKLREYVADTAFKQLYGQRVVDMIVERTHSGIDRQGRSLGTYSKAYKDSLVFGIYGKSNPVNLTLTGDMLESLNAKNGKYTITVQLEGDLNKGKAQGHITGILGKYGRAKPRDFLGLPEGLLKSMFKESMRDYRADALTEIAV
jgi:hypothetical protein